VWAFAWHEFGFGFYLRWQSNQIAEKGAMMTNTDQLVARLRKNVASTNFVYVVGYALEKVHSGVLANLINGQHGRELAASFWNALGEPQVKATDLEQPEANREYKTGQHSVVDLVVSFKNKSTGLLHHIVYEYKVDGTSDHWHHEQQCLAIRKNWELSHGHDLNCFAFVTAGGSRFWMPPPCFKHVDLPLLQELLLPYDSVALIHEYLEALEDERIRGEIAPTVPLADNEKRQLGYRGYDWWYAFYSHLKKSMGTEREWSIYSGGPKPRAYDLQPLLVVFRPG
jgi:hypothetical protein